MYLPPSMIAAIAKERQEERVRYFLGDSRMPYYEAPRLSLNWLKRLFTQTISGADQSAETMMNAMTAEAKPLRLTTQEIKMRSVAERNTSHANQRTAETEPTTS